ncbi:MAG: hypothetical protein UY95_C0001G0008 [Parcubacteria group bacterium GW2011_GWA2_56_7]|nr:MAG: hypothetical protein UY95_C0001G0008 [Parcubacteria group bacterium GW2011_GWA2_56_7]
MLVALPNWLEILTLAALPVSEIRGALPLGLLVYDMPFWSVYLLGVVGNTIPACALLFGFRAIDQRLNPQGVFSKFLGWFRSRAERKLQSSYDLYGAIALFIFTAIPLPFTGAWTASVAAVAFRVSPKKALPAIFLGVCVAGALVAIIVGGAERVF